MADIKEYSYYRRGSQFAIMEVDTTTLPNTTIQGDSLWKSPQESIADGIEIEYSYSGKYFINNILVFYHIYNFFLSSRPELEVLLSLLLYAFDLYQSSEKFLDLCTHLVIFLINL